ncbi:putative 50S ribosomal protein L6, chloroplastic-like [Capsicum annuum]|nr:putative 50S ribosomal protein L6, chloroplastic-like [Capsicum annuum]KAF3664510.1 putative 50S ribosomal protein L6, chloroplastic-like [Capsicum annuum]
MGVYSAPKLDFEKSSELKKGSEKWNLLRDEVSKALEEYGCFEALLDGEIPKVKLYEKLKEVLNINLEKIIGDTQSVLVGSDSHNYELQAPLQQRLDIPYVLNDGAIENFSKNFWPNGESEFRTPKAGESNVGVPPHTDFIISTILSQHDQDGLQILDKNGQWLDVQFSTPNSYVFFVSDCLKAFTNGRLNCLTHRVIVGNGERYSLSFPLIPKEGYIIKVPEELVDEDHPLLYKPFDGSKLFPFFMSEGRRGVSATLEDFCGVSTNNPNLS